MIPNLSFAADAHYHHLTDDIIEGGLMRYENGAIARARRARASASNSIARSCASTASCTSGSADIRTTRIPAGQAGLRSSPTTVGRIRRRSMRWICLSDRAAAPRRDRLTTPGCAMRRVTPPPALPAVVTVNGDSLVLRSAQQELIRGLRGMTGRTLRAESGAAARAGNRPRVSRRAVLTVDAFSLQVRRAAISIIRGGERSRRPLRRLRAAPQNRARRTGRRTR